MILLSTFQIFVAATYLKDLTYYATGTLSYLRDYIDPDRYTQHQIIELGILTYQFGAISLIGQCTTKEEFLLIYKMGVLSDIAIYDIEFRDIDRLSGGDILDKIKTLIRLSEITNLILDNFVVFEYSSNIQNREYLANTKFYKSEIGFENEVKKYVNNENQYFSFFEMEIILSKNSIRIEYLSSLYSLKMCVTPSDYPYVIDESDDNSECLIS